MAWHALSTEVKLLKNRDFMGESRRLIVCNNATTTGHHYDEFALTMIKIANFLFLIHDRIHQ